MQTQKIIFQRTIILLNFLTTEQFLLYIWVMLLSQCEIKFTPCHTFEVKLLITTIYSIIVVIFYMWNLVLFSIKTDRSPKVILAQYKCLQMHSCRCLFYQFERSRIHTVLLYSVTHLDILYVAINIFDVLWVLVQVYALARWLYPKVMSLWGYMYKKIFKLHLLLSMCP